jgi:tyrosine-protein kinase Etk/Wzc
VEQKSSKQATLIPAEPSSAPRLGEYLIILRKRKWIILFSVLFLTGIYAVNTYTTTPIYMATTSILYETDNSDSQVISRYSPIGFYPNRMETEMQILQSRAISLDVVNRLALAFEPAAALPRNILFEEPYVGQGLAAGDYRLVENGTTFEVFNDAGVSLGTGQYDGLFEHRSSAGDLLLSFTFHDSTPESGRIIGFSTLDPIPLAEGIRRSTQISEGSGNTFLISVSHSDPAMCSRIANTVAESYQEQNLGWKREKASVVSDFISKQIVVAELKLRQAEDLVREYKETTGIASFDHESRTTITKLAEIQTRRRSYEDDLAEYLSIQSTVLSNINEINPDPGIVVALTSLTVLKGDVALMAIASEVVAYREERARLAETTGPLNPRLEEIDRQIASTMERLTDALRDAATVGILASKIEGIRSRIREVDQERVQYDALYEELPRREMELELLVRKTDVQANIHSMLLQRYEEAQINEKMEAADVRILDHAMTPLAPISPNHASDLMIGFILGLVVGVGLALLIEFNDTTVKTAEEVTRATGLTAIGYIPLPADIDTSQAQPLPILLSNPRSPVAEAYRVLRTNIQYFSVDKKIHLLSVTSPGKGEGKTTTVANIGISVAQQGNKTLLIDTDLRKARLHKLFRMPSTPGFTELILGDRTEDEVLRPTEVENLDILTSGHLPPNPSELLSSRRTADILERLKERYDRIIMDTPPVLAVTDPAILGTIADGTIIVLQSAGTQLDAARETVKLLRQARVSVIGFVLNKVDVSKSYRARRYYYYYHRYGEETKQKKGSLWQRLRGKK